MTRNRLIWPLLAVILIVAGVLLQPAGDALDRVPSGVIGMGHDGYDISHVPNAHLNADGTPVIRIHVGDVLRFQNNSRWVHIVGPGSGGLLSAPGHGAMTPLKLMEQNQTYSTAPWMTPGVFKITCTVHPDMNALVVVLPRSA